MHGCILYFTAIGNNIKKIKMHFKQKLLRLNVNHFLYNLPISELPEADPGSTGISFPLERVVLLLLSLDVVPPGPGAPLVSSVCVAENSDNSIESVPDKKSLNCIASSVQGVLYTRRQCTRRYHFFQQM